MDVNSQDQIDVYAGRGVLVQSQGPTWMYGTASEHHVPYQYQISAAKDPYMSMIQTESPYFQSVPPAPSPFTAGLFPNDPTFSGCDGGSKACAVSWALRIIDSSSIYCMGAGLYSWFSDYTQDCLKSENCQQRGVEIAQSTDTWIYNLVTKGMVEMVSPVNEDPTLSANNGNGFMSSILAWIRQANATIGERKFPGFQFYDPEWLDGVSNPCKTAPSQKILCHPFLEAYYQSPGIGRNFGNQTLTDEFTPVLTLAEECSYCYTTMLQMREASPYAAFTERDMDDLIYVIMRASFTTHVCIQCDAQYAEGGHMRFPALKYKVASAAIQIGNPTLINNCTALVSGRELCRPLSCDIQYTVKDGDTCLSIEWANQPTVAFGSVRKYNSWLNSECTNLQSTHPIHGSVICLSPQAGAHNSTGTVPTTDGNSGGASSSQYSEVVTGAPANAIVANGTTSLCGKWYTAAAGDTCATIFVEQGISSRLFMAVNPSLKSGCDGSLLKGTTYCVSPDLYWDDPDFWK
ncbi:hypothetical protein CNMCM7691_002873 [Aspergillus felis]|uniref:LysM domain-containing protein n=1 Tax=Aspergillus felis TaxID=1287682 RepID=A0A8H6R1S9_9EURO|nr:hypothetical protein CNMCM7691_002873 [Aspergillus felis]